MTGMRITKVDDTFYKLEVGPTVSAFADASSRAMARAVAISGLPVPDFFRAILRLLRLSDSASMALFANSGLHSVADAAQAVLSGEVIPCFDVVLAAAVVAGTTVGMLLEEGSFADEVRGVMRDIRLLKADVSVSDFRPGGGVPEVL